MTTPTTERMEGIRFADTPTVETLRTLLRYEPETARLFWRERSREIFRHGLGCDVWNARYAHSEAFTAINSGGYRSGSIFKKMYHAHRVIWAMHTGAWPKGCIDHIDGNRLNNKIENLRDVSFALNMRNTKMHRHNTSGHTGVLWREREAKWCAQIHVNGRNLHLGQFDAIDDAIAARKAAEVDHGFTKRHGEVHQ